MCDYSVTIRGEAVSISNRGDEDELLEQYAIRSSIVPHLCEAYLSLP